MAENESNISYKPPEDLENKIDALNFGDCRAESAPTYKRGKRGRR